VDAQARELPPRSTKESDRLNTLVASPGMSGSRAVRSAHDVTSVQRSSAAIKGLGGAPRHSAAVESPRVHADAAPSAAIANVVDSAVAWCHRRGRHEAGDHRRVDLRVVDRARSPRRSA
jgi:hypothetical protein